MRIVVISEFVPIRDLSAGWFRFFSMLELLSRDHEVFLHPFGMDSQILEYGSERVFIYVEQLQRLGVQVTDGTWKAASKILSSGVVHVGLFEHHGSVARNILESFRRLQPEARLVVDTVDVEFSRLAAKARVTGCEKDLRKSQLIRQIELDTYSRVDLVIAVSPTDEAILRAEAPGMRLEVIPLIYSVMPLKESIRAFPRCEILYVAHFDHDANVDGLRYFCRDVLPLIIRELPDVRLRVVGASPPPEVQELASRNVEILGFVPDLNKVYTSSDVAIAPMRYGGGLKGKIAEAMSHGVPVVTNSASLAGFGITPGREALVGDDGPDFARGVVSLLLDRELHLRVRRDGWEFVNTNYSRDAVGKMLRNLMAGIGKLPVKKLPLTKRLLHDARTAMDRHVLWRF